MVRAKFAEWMSGFMIDGAKRVGNELHFPSASSKSDVLEAVNKAGRDGNMCLSLGEKAIGDDELTRLKALYPNVPFDTGVVFEAHGANTVRDWGNQKFSQGILELYAKQVREMSRTVMWQHRPDTHGLGMLFHAEIVPSSKAQGESDMRVFLLIDNESIVPHQTKNLVKSIQNGYVKFLSIGFRAWLESVEYKSTSGETTKEWTYIIDPMRPHTMDAFISEISLVHFAEQKGTTIGAKALNDIEFINDLNMTKTIEVKVGEKSYPITIDVAGDVITVKGDTELNAAIKAASDEATTKAVSLQAERDALAAPFVADIVNAKLTGLDEPTVKAFTVEKLIETSKAVTKGVKVEEAKAAPANEKQFPQVFKSEKAHV